MWLLLQRYKHITEKTNSKTKALREVSNAIVKNPVVRKRLVTALERKRIKAIQDQDAPTLAKASSKSSGKEATPKGVGGKPSHPRSILSTGAANTISKVLEDLPKGP